MSTLIPPGEPTTDPAAAAAVIAGATTAPPAAPTTPPAGAGTSEAAFDAPFNLNDVPEDMRPHVEAYNKQLQGAFTRKTQELAEQRRQLQPAQDLYQRLHADDEATRDAAVREALKAGGWNDLTPAEQGAVVEAVQDQQQRTEQPAPTATPDPRYDELNERIRRQEAAESARAEAEQQAAQDAYLEDFTQRYVGAVETWAKANGFKDGESLPEHIKTQIAGYVRGVPVLEENGHAFPNMDVALKLLDADRAAYFTSKEPGTAPNTAAVTAQPVAKKARSDADRLALANQIASRHV